MPIGKLHMTMGRLPLSPSLASTHKTPCHADEGAALMAKAGRQFLFAADARSGS